MSRSSTSFRIALLVAAGALVVLVAGGVSVSRLVPRGLPSAPAVGSPASGDDPTPLRATPGAR